jgi:hypothetical protein
VFEIAAQRGAAPVTHPVAAISRTTIAYQWAQQHD